VVDSLLSVAPTPVREAPISSELDSSLFEIAGPVLPTSPVGAAGMPGGRVVIQCGVCILQVAGILE